MLSESTSWRTDNLYLKDSGPEEFILTVDIQLYHSIIIIIYYQKHKSFFLLYTKT